MPKTVRAVAFLFHFIVITVSWVGVWGCDGDGMPPRLSRADLR